MLIWINGAFGVGKTSVAKELARAMPEAMEFDPEQIGFMLRRMIAARDRPADFQDLKLWRELVVQVAAGWMRQFGRPLLMPMTVVNPVYLDEIMLGLRDAGVEVHHFTLLASRRVLRSRLLKRWSSPQSKVWTMGRIDECVAAFSNSRFGTHVDTDGRTIGEIATEIRSRLGV